jgi:hypothetical protein
MLLLKNSFCNQPVQHSLVGTIKVSLIRNEDFIGKLRNTFDN